MANLDFFLVVQNPDGTLAPQSGVWNDDFNGRTAAGAYLKNLTTQKITGYSVARVKANIIQKITQ